MLKHILLVIGLMTASISVYLYVSRDRCATLPPNLNFRNLGVEALWQESTTYPGKGPSQDETFIPDYNATWEYKVTDRVTKDMVWCFLRSQ